MVIVIIMDFKQIEYLGTQLRVYTDGTIYRFYKASNKWGKKGEWNILTPTLDNGGYFTTCINHKNVKVHRLVAFAYLELDINNSKILIDHINRVRTDNRVENLRIATPKQNCFNRNNTKGYSKYKNGKCRVFIYIEGKQKYLGTYNTEEEASKVYNDAKLIHHII